MVVVLMETAKLDGLVGSLQWTLHIAVFATAVRLQSQTAVRPQWSLGAKPVRRLDQCDPHSRPNRSDTGDLAKQLGRAMLAALRQQIVSRGWT